MGHGIITLLCLQLKHAYFTDKLLNPFWLLCAQLWGWKLWFMIDHGTDQAGLRNMSLYIRKKLYTERIGANLFSCVIFWSYWNIVIQLYIGQHQLEGDALQVVQVLKKEGENWSRYVHLIDKTRGVLNSLQRWKANHVNQTLNGTAHRLAKEALAIREEYVLVEEFP